MDETKARAEVHRTIIERYPMYHEDPAFEAWLFHRAGRDVGKVAKYLDALAAYGLLDGEGMVSADYAAMPEPSALRQALIDRQAFGDNVEGLPIDRVDRHLWSAE